MDASAPDLIVIVPSRGRPSNVERLHDAMEATCVMKTTLVLGLDQDDPCLPEYAKLGIPRIEIDGLRQVVAWINAMSNVVWQAAPLIGHLGDDNVPRTVGWDRAVVEALGRQPFAFADDLNRDRPVGSLCCHIFMRSEIIRKLGYMAPPSLKHMYADPVWWEWGKAVGMEFIHDAVIEHLHPSVGKAEMDESYHASLAQVERDRRAYENYCADPGGLASDIAKLRA